MKTIFKFVFACLITTIASSVFATEAPKPYYGISAKNAPLASQVTLVNLTRESYMSYSLYRGTGQTFRMPLSAAGTSQDTIIYPIAYPVYDVCLDVIQDFTGTLVYHGCMASGTIYVHYTADNKTVTVS